MASRRSGSGRRTSRRWPPDRPVTAIPMRDGADRPRFGSSDHMPEPTARLYLITPILVDAENFAPRMGEACAAGDVAAVLIRLAAADERTLVNRLKALAPVAQDK